MTRNSKGIEVAEIMQDKCMACQICIAECPVGAILLNSAGVAEIDPEVCVGCGKCADVCPVERNIVESRIWYTSDEGGYSLAYRDRAFIGERRHNVFTVGRTRFDRWFASKAIQKGALVVCGTVVTDLLKDDSGRIRGVRTDREHVALAVKEVIELSEETVSQPCLFICPARVYTLKEDGQINMAYEGCLECGSGRIGCPHLNIEWRFPRGGYSVRHKFG